MSSLSRGQGAKMASRDLTPGVACVALIAVSVLCGCSKSERPAPPVPKAVKPPAVSNAVSEKAAGTGNEYTTERAKPGVREKYAKSYPFAEGKTNAPAVSPEESMRAAKERERAMVRRVIGEAIVRTQQEMDRVADQMAAAEAAARTNQPAVKAAWATLGEKRAAYDAERGGIPGMNELLKQREAAKLRLAELTSNTTAPAAADVEGLRAEIRRLGKAMIDLELQGRTEYPALQNAADAFRAAESGYQAGLIASPDFGELAKQHQELQVQYTSLVKRQSDFTKEGRKHE